MDTTQYRQARLELYFIGLDIRSLSYWITGKMPRGRKSYFETYEKEVNERKQRSVDKGFTNNLEEMENYLEKESRLENAR